MMSRKKTNFRDYFCDAAIPALHLLYRESLFEIGCHAGYIRQAFDLQPPASNCFGA
jgi:hypothetical protein